MIVHSDLEPGVYPLLVHHVPFPTLIEVRYEGGFKMWECTADLIEFLFSTKVDFSNKQVFEV